MARNGKVEMIGHIGVDNAVVMIGDPWYYFDEAEEANCMSFITDFSKSVKTLNETTDTAAVSFMPHAGCAQAIVVGGFGGDGTFPVYIKRDESGRVTELIVRFKR
jgi:hypothetical protein